MLSKNNHKPRIRPLDFQPVWHKGQQMWLLRDPQQLSEYQLIFPPLLAQMLVYCDGTSTLTEIQTALSTDAGFPVPLHHLEDALAQLDEACLLENERFWTARKQALSQYRAQPHRPPALAGLSYPADPEELDFLFAEYGASDNLNGWRSWSGRGIISPHIDYQRGGPVYAKVWRRAQPAVAEADIVLMFGTDHNGGLGTITLTEKAYATPYGVLPTDKEMVQRIAAAIGPEHAFALELNHRQEHAIELSAVWLHHTYRQLGLEPRPMIPILCGSFHHFVTHGSHPSQDPQMNSLINVLKEATQGKRVLAIASVDLAHVGPNFGDPFPMDKPRRQAIRESDQRLMAATRAGQADIFYQEIAQVRDQNRICGFSSIYLMLRFLENHQGQEIAYAHCPADDQDNSLVSICGLLLD
ncbi:MAG: AmmeMemoRadiSam system protein B [Chloroflexi bacterium]|nr:AmmeMemoRadiSam system protein B [Chloroflexota bacterium]MBP8057196.1 AmmeMemoRadiSam system protein B [Chloroflexota bacterium]